MKNDFKKRIEKYYFLLFFCQFMMMLFFLSIPLHEEVHLIQHKIDSKIFNYNITYSEIHYLGCPYNKEYLGCYRHLKNETSKFYEKSTEIVAYGITFSIDIILSYLLSVYLKRKIFK